MLYSDLNLKKLREDCDIDFAHYTYLPNQCSCCYGPKDLPKRYWRNNTIPEGDDYEYILFKNANNGSGTVKANDIIEDAVCISWSLSAEKLQKVCEALRSQLTSDYEVLKPLDDMHTIVILSLKFHTRYCTSNELYQTYRSDGRYVSIGVGTRDKKTLASYK